MQTLPLIHALSQIVTARYVFGPTSPEYDKLRSVWNGMIDRHPLAIALPQNAQEVAAIITLAAREGLPLAIRCGGHSFPGFSTCDGGIVLHLSRLNRVAIDPVSRIAEVGGGALLGDLDRAAAPFGLVTPAGLVSHTGAGGLVLGGGMGWTSRRLGLSVDSLLAAELATADGTIMDVSAHSHPDLFWALRGGGGNFGVVTRFRFRLHHLGKVTVGNWHYAPDQAHDALLTLSDRAAHAPRSVTTVFNMTNAALSLTAFHSGEETGGEAAIAPFADLAGPGQGGKIDTDYVTLQSRSDAALRPGRRYYGKGGFLNRLGAPVADLLATLGRTAPTEACEIYMLQLGGAVADVAEDATAYSGRSAAFYWIVQPVWDDPADDTACLKWGAEGGRQMADLSQAGNYLNEQGEVSPELTMQAYGQVKYDRLARLKARYDPGNLFRLNQNIAPSP